MLRGLLRYSLLFSVGCQVPIELDFASDDQYLVIDGFITDQPGPHSISISRSIPFVNDEISVFEKVTGANASIVDQLGNEVILSEASPGIYETNGLFRGEIGYRYTLAITIDGERFQSTPQEIPVSAELDSVYFKQGVRENINNDGTILESTTVDFFCDIGYQSANDYVAATWESTYEFKAGQTLNTCYVDKRNIGFSSVNSNAGIGIGSSPQVTVGKFLFNFEFESAYSLNTILYSMGEEAYDFYDKVNQQRNSTGSVFDPQPFQIFGNISNLDRPSQTVLGFFGAFSQVDKRIFVYPSDIDASQPYDICTKRNPPSYCFNCLNYPGAYIQRPTYWKDQ